MQRDDADIRLVIACFLIQEGADMKQISMLGLSDTQTLAMIGATNATVSTVVKEFCGKYGR